MAATSLSISDLTFIWPGFQRALVRGRRSRSRSGPHRARRPERVGQIHAAALGSRGGCARSAARSLCRVRWGTCAGSHDQHWDSASTILGIRSTRDALHRIESGAATEPTSTTSAGRYREECAVALLGKLDFRPHRRRASPAGADDRNTLGRRGRIAWTHCGTAARSRRLAARRTDEHLIALRETPYEVVAQFPGGRLVVVSHDRELLDRMDIIAEDGGVRLFGGNFTVYEQTVAAEQEAARAAFRDAKNDVRKQGRELVEARTKLDRRKRYGKKMFEQREPKIVMGLRKMQAEESAYKLRNNHIEKLEEAKATLDEAEKALRDDREIQVDLPATRLYAGQDVIDPDDFPLACGPVVTLKVSGAGNGLP